MTNQSIVTALTLGFLGFTLSILPVTTASTEPAIDPKVACESKGTRYRYDPQTGSCIKSIKKTKPPTSGGVGGGSDDCGPGYYLNPEKGCMKCEGYTTAEGRIWPPALVKAEIDARDLKGRGK